MADYYPLIARAVAGLPNSTPQTRSAIYRRARNALFSQLRGLDPPIPESDVARESAALEVAIARLEAELAPAPEAGPGLTHPFEAAPSDADAPSPAPPPPPVREERKQIEAAPANGAVAAPDAHGHAPPGEAQEQPAPPGEAKEQPAPPDEADGHSAAPAAEAPGEGAGAPPAPTRPQGAPPPAFFKLRRDRPAFTPPPAGEASAARRAGAAPTFRAPLFPPPPGSAPPPPAQPPSTPSGDFFRPWPEADAGAPHGEDAQEAPQEVPQEAAPSATSEAPAAGDLHPPPPAEDDFDSAAGFDSAAAGENAAARRISPALSKSRPEAQRPFAPQPAREDATPRRLWIVGFVVGLLVLLVAVAAFHLRDRPEDLRQKAMTPVIQPEAGANGKIVDRIGVGSEATQGSAAADRAARGPAAPAEETAPAGGRAALLVEAPEEPSKVRTFLGSVAWKVDNVSSGPGDPLSMAVSADIDIPEEKLQTSMTLQKNFDGSLPASHTMKIQFTEAADSPLGPIQQISVPQMRREETATGDALSGIPVAITDNSFLVGLTRGNAEATNMDLLASREWIDVPMVLSNGKIAKLTFEKGPAGNRAIGDALAAWKAQ